MNTIERLEAAIATASTPPNARDLTAALPDLSKRDLSDAIAESRDAGRIQISPDGAGWVLLASAWTAVIHSDYEDEVGPLGPFQTAAQVETVLLNLGFTEGHPDHEGVRCWEHPATHTPFVIIPWVDRGPSLEALTKSIPKSAGPGLD